MTLAQLRYFCTAARYHSITQAAKALFVTQPTISIAIRELEKEFSLTLFTHSGSQLSLTEEGEIFYNKVSAILADCEDLRADYASSALSKATVRIGIPPMLSTIFFPELLNAFHDEYPDIWLELQEFGSIRACDLVQNDILDIALINMEIPNVDKFHARLLLSEPLLYCVGRNHPFAGKTEIRLIKNLSSSLYTDSVMQEVEVVKIHRNDFFLCVETFQFHCDNPLYWFLEKSFKYIMSFFGIQLFCQLLRDSTTTSSACLS